MNRSSRGFGLIGVFLAVIILIVSAVMSTSASSQEMTVSVNATNPVGTK